MIAAHYTDQATDQARPNIDRTRVSKSTGNTLGEAGSHWPGNGAQAHARRVPLCVWDEARATVEDERHGAGNVAKPPSRCKRSTARKKQPQDSPQTGSSQAQRD
ncbi:MAG: hypothetical protein RR784_06115 [Burkholderiaceae bacterium]